ncbi:MAG: hypothetical protein ACI4EN_09800 [Butyrivibrio sp.]
MEELFDNDVLRVVIPDGWKLFGGMGSDGNPSPKKLHIYKNALDETDIYVRAGITVCLFKKGEKYTSTKDFYDNVMDLEPFMMGEHMWSGYTCTSLGYPYVMLDTIQDGCVIQVMILTENGEHKISLNDMDVQTILGSISVIN